MTRSLSDLLDVQTMAWPTANVSLHHNGSRVTSNSNPLAYQSELFSGQWTDLTGVPAFGTASLEDVGTANGDVVQLEDVGGSPGLPAVDGSQLLNLPGGGGSSFPVPDDEGMVWVSGEGFWRTGTGGIQMMPSDNTVTIGDGTTVNNTGLRLWGNTVDRDMLIQGNALNMVFGGLGTATKGNVASVRVGTVDFGLSLRSDALLGWTSGNSNSNLVDVKMQRVGAGLLGLYDTSLSIYNDTFEGTTNYERGFMRWDTNEFVIGTENAGTGGGRGVLIDSDTNVRFMAWGNPYTFTNNYLSPESVGSKDLGSGSAFNWRNIYWAPGATPPTLAQNGTLAWSTPDDTTVRIHYRGSDGVTRDFDVGSGGGGGGFPIADNEGMTWSSGEGFWRDGAGIVSLREGANPQEFRVYNTYTDASNYERVGMRWDSNRFDVIVENAGTGTLRDMKFLANVINFNDSMFLQPSNVAFAKDLVGYSNGNFNIGQTGTVWKDFYQRGDYINYNDTFSGTTNYERGFMRWDGNVLKIGTEAAGTGTNRSLAVFRGASEVALFGGSSVSIRGRVEPGQTNNIAWTLGASNKLWGGLYLSTQHLPTSDPAVAGQVWNDAGTLKISAG